MKNNAQGKLIIVVYLSYIDQVLCSRATPINLSSSCFDCMRKQHKNKDWKFSLILGELSPSVARGFKYNPRLKI